MNKLSNKTKGKILEAIGWVLCIVPPTIATLEYFPLFKDQPEKGVSAVTVVILFIAAIPFWKYIKRALRSPSAWMVWLVIFLFSRYFSPIIHQMEAVSFISLATSIVGALFFKFARKYLPPKNKNP